MSDIRECITLAILCVVWYSVEKDKIARVLAIGGAIVWAIATVLAMLIYLTE